MIRALSQETVTATRHKSTQVVPTSLSVGSGKESTAKGVTTRYPFRDILERQTEVVVLPKATRHESERGGRQFTNRQPANSEAAGIAVSPKVPAEDKTPKGAVMLPKRKSNLEPSNQTTNQTTNQTIDEAPLNTKIELSVLHREVQSEVQSDTPPATEQSSPNAMAAASSLLRPAIDPLPETEAATSESQDAAAPQLLLNPQSALIESGSIPQAQTSPNRAEKTPLTAGKNAVFREGLMPVPPEEKTQVLRESLVAINKLGLAFELRFQPTALVSSMHELLNLRSHFVQGLPSEPNLVDDPFTELLRPMESAFTSSNIAIDLSLNGQQRSGRETSDEEPRGDEGAIAKSSPIREADASVGVNPTHGTAIKMTLTNPIAKSMPVQPTEPTIEAVPTSKRTISQLVLRVGEESNSHVAVRLNLHGSGLRMEVLGQDTALRESLRIALPHLEKSLERQAAENGWRVSASLPSTGQTISTNLSEPTADSSGSNQQGSPSRDEQDAPSQQRRNRTQQQFNLIPELFQTKELFQ